MKKYENFIRCLVLSCGISLALATPALSESTAQYTPEQLTDLAAAWLEQTLDVQATDLEIQLSALDSRIGSKDCAHQPTFNLPNNYNPRQTTVQISCSAPLSWQLFIPVRLTEWLEVVVSRQNITPGTMLTADMLELQRRERRLVRGLIVQDPTQIIGSKNKRSLSVGQVISLQELCLVCRGDVVTIQINQQGLAVSTTGIAQHDGSLGDTVQVRNQQSGRSISTEVVGVNQVRVKF
ncbi:flagellar basal body P-ring formation chaperone FlgA [Alishewanella jeotgali]|uniref:Flagella basal body P-ring formation protein FlgA n=1 Tax=Alishewanella jeotgali KCTC 22429 TaxID=1129374 RepID=H3ZBM2_9ALTE|nr:flagellar basal body P-ring formation chaperone FlgA [Alishewanella jeotgali]EHR42336.1 flagellar biosynthesis; assembly of basal-body periplasmic P-ring [Alishewanella jeotgali KCTC 22429]